MKPPIFLILALTVFLFACGGKKQTSVNNSTDTTATQSTNEVPDEKNMDHYTSGYQNWTDGMTQDETFAMADLWYDGRFIIISDGIQPKITLKVGKKTTEEKNQLDKEIGGLSTRTVYEIEANNEGYDELIIFTNEFPKKLHKYDYTCNFTLSNKKFTKSYYCNMDK